MDYDKKKEIQYKESVSLWVDSQKNYIEELDLRLRFSKRDCEHFCKMIEHEKEVLRDYLKETSK